MSDANDGDRMEIELTREFQGRNEQECEEYVTKWEIANSDFVVTGREMKLRGTQGSKMSGTPNSPVGFVMTIEFKESGD